MRTRMKSLLLGGALAALTVVPGSPAQGAPNAHSNVHAMKVYVGYADGIRGDPTVPSPWDDDPGVVFVGSGDRFDAGAIRIVNPSAQPLTIDDVWVQIGASQYAIWTFPMSVPAKGSLILTQTDGDTFNFDTSEPGVVTCEPTGDVPVIHITVGSRHPKTRTFLDTGQVLNTGGIDVGAAECGGTNEGLPWVRIHGHD